MKKNTKELQLKIINVLDSIVGENLKSKKLKNITKSFAKKLSKRIAKAENIKKKEDKKQAKKTIKKLSKQEAKIWNEKTENPVKKIN